jgi:hypothetical protein
MVFGTVWRERYVEDVEEFFNKCSEEEDGGTLPMERVMWCL